MSPKVIPLLAALTLLLVGASIYEFVQRDQVEERLTVLERPGPCTEKPRGDACQRSLTTAIHALNHRAACSIVRKAGYRCRRQISAAESRERRRDRDRRQKPDRGEGGGSETGGPPSGQPSPPQGGQPGNGGSDPGGGGSDSSPPGPAPQPNPPAEHGGLAGDVDDAVDDVTDTTCDTAADLNLNAPGVC